MKKLFINPKEHRPRALLRLILAIGIFFLSVLIIMSITALIGKIKFIHVREVRALWNNELVYSFGQLLATWVSYLVAFRWLDRRPLADFGFRLNRIWWRDFSFGLLLGAGLMALIFGVELEIGRAHV
jgi:hypothetical protein